ncbi:MAG: DUF3810 domain-containing protein [Flavobacteriaceae bacterium]|nr:DUF3810 domain-containing protein [Flavobacteriaceae bacterium]
MKWNKTHIVVAAFLPVQMILMRLAENHPNVIEVYYSIGIYPYISSFFRILLGWIPFSIGDMLLSILLFIIIRFLFLLIKNKFKDFIKKIIKATAFASTIYFCFYLFWGLNYYREPLAKSLGFEQRKHSNTELENVTNYIIENLNRTHLKITNNDSIKVNSPYSSKDFYKLAIDGYNNLAIKYPQFNYKQSSIKNSLMSELQSYNGTSGYINPLTGEAHVNKLVPKTSYPTTTCHEMAHQIGYAAENEANFIGFLAANYNNDLYFKYASYRMAFGYCIAEVRKRDPKLYQSLWKKVNKGIIQDFNDSYEFWNSYKNIFEPLVKKGYNTYLKANKQSKGTDSYNYVVDLLISYYRKQVN